MTYLQGAKPGFSSVGRAVDCSGLWLSTCHWFDSSNPEIGTRPLYSSVHGIMVEQMPSKHQTRVRFPMNALQRDVHKNVYVLPPALHKTQSWLPVQI